MEYYQDQMGEQTLTHMLQERNIKSQDGIEQKQLLTPNQDSTTQAESS